MRFDLDIKEGRNAVLEASRMIAGLKRSVHAGYLSAVKYETPHQNRPGPTLATIALVHQRGAPSKNIPPRPFITQGLQMNAEKIKEDTREAVKKGIRTGLVKEALSIVGARLRSAIMDGIDKGSYPPLKASTIQSRRYRLRVMGVRKDPSTKPLLFTGQLRNRVRWRIV
jgi:hypothetical protein